RIEVTTAYPLLLNFYNDYSEGVINIDDFETILKTLENYLIRRFVCNIATNQLNKIFPSIYPTIQSNYSDNIVEGFKAIIQDKGYPKDNEFLLRFRETKFYGGGDRVIKTKLILETIENSFNHKESVPFENLTIEHIMPQTLSEWWQEHLGEEWEETHEIYLHTIGNLTLTAYNTELSNDDFLTKKITLNQSHLELNKYFKDISGWTRNDIERRSEELATIASQIWSYFGQENSKPTNIQEVTGTTPIALKILGQRFEVKSWRDVLEKTMNVIAELEPDKFEIITHNFPRYINKDRNKFRAIRQLENGYFIEVNLSAQSIQKLCYQAMETIELTSDEWEVLVE
ncbi:MAG: HNH endonuclease family protein, partial [Candidatus Kapaibacterium sp.]